MVQNPKGGGLSSTLGGSQMMGGVQKTTDFLDKSTWTLATMLIVLIIMSSLSFDNGSASSESKLIEDSGKSAPASTTPATPVPATATPAQTVPVETAPAQ